MRKLGWLGILLAVAATPAIANPPAGGGMAHRWPGSGWQGRTWHHFPSGHRTAGHVRFRRGWVMPPTWIGPRFWVNDWRGYGFPAPGQGQSWVRYYDDAYLVDHGGRVHDSIYDIDWVRYDHGPVPDYVGDGEGRYLEPDYDAWSWGDEAVTWRRGRYQAAPYPAPGAGNVIVVPPGSVTTIVIRSEPTVTTRYVEEVAPAPRKKTWKPKARAKRTAWRAKAQAQCACK